MDTVNCQALTGGLFNYLEGKKLVELATLICAIVVVFSEAAGCFLASTSMMAVN